MKKFLAISLLFLASTSIAQPGISPEELGANYGRLSLQWFVTEHCAIEGRISAETAAFGKQILRQSIQRYELDQEVFNIYVAEFKKKRTRDLNIKHCNQIAMQIEDLRLQQNTATAQAQAKAQLEQQQQRDAQAKAQAQAQFEQQQRREAQMAAQMETQRKQQEVEANAAYQRREMDKMGQQLNQIGQQWQNFGNSVQPRTTNCTRTLMGASCTSY